MAEISGELNIKAIRERLSYPEIVGWQTYLAEKQKNIEKTEYYLAQLTATVLCLFGGDVDVEDLLIDWEAGSGEPVKIEMDELALNYARGVGAIIVDKRKQVHG
nr:MAG TPA: Minor tail protein T [Caudoviricetes sp.]